LDFGMNELCGERGFWDEEGGTCERR